MFPEAAIVFEETKRGNIHLHACCTATFKSYGDFKDWFLDLYKMSSVVKKHGRYDIGMLCKEVTNSEGLKEYMSKSPFRGTYYSLINKNPKTYRIKKLIPRIFKKKIYSKDIDNGI